MFHIILHLILCIKNTNISAADRGNTGMRIQQIRILNNANKQIKTKTYYYYLN